MWDTEEDCWSGTLWSTPTTNSYLCLSKEKCFLLHTYLYVAICMASHTRLEAVCLQLKHKITVSIIKIYIYIYIWMWVVPWVYFCLTGWERGGREKKSHFVKNANPLISILSITSVKRIIWEPILISYQFRNSKPDL